MSSINDSSDATRVRGAPLMGVRPSEWAALATSFAMFFTLLAAYYIIRPVRDDMGVSVGKDQLHELFTVVFFVMLAAVPAFGFAVSRFPRRLVLPALYLFFILNIVGFWAALRSGQNASWVAAAFFVWASVFNLFVVSLFWSLMSEVWSTEEAKRLYGFIGAGGTAGALAGPLLTQGLIRFVPTHDLLLAAATLLTLALVLSLLLRRLKPAAGGHEEAAAGGGLFDGAVRVATDPFFRRIALYVLLANIVGTFFYMEQSRLVSVAFTESADRVAFFSSRDLIVSILTLAIEIFGTAAVMRRLGPGVALIALPLTALIGTLALTSAPLLWVVAAVMVAERVAAFSLSSPATKIMYTLAAPAEKYKVQSFIDTVVYRGGDAASGYLFKGVSGGLGFATAALPAVAMPLVLLWLWTARDLGRTYQAKAEAAQNKEAPAEG